MTVQEAADQMGISAQALRVWITQKEKHPFGEVIRQKASRSGKNSYYINEVAFRRFMKGEK